MPRVMALTQFVFLALGTMAMNVLVKIAPSAAGTSREGLFEMAGFLARNGLWLILIPMFYAVYGEIAQNKNSGIFRVSIAHAVGVVIAAAILIVYGFVILAV